MTTTGHREAKAKITVQAVVSDKPRDGEQLSENTGSETTIFSKEQFLTVDIELRKIDGDEEQQNKSHLILVVDNSGSMAGQPWKQVKESLHAILGASVDHAHLKTDLVVYNSKASRVPFNKSNYKDKIDSLQASGMTNFVKAFNAVYDCFSNTGEEHTKTVVVFLTDGRDTVNSEDTCLQLIPQLRRDFNKHSKQATVHAVGFSRDHDFRFMKKLAEEGGACPGMFRYCEPTDDKQALQSKLDELFDFILESNDKKVTIELGGDRCSILGLKNKTTQSTSVSAKVIKQTGENKNKNVIHLVAETWIYSEESNDLPSLSVFVETDMKVKGSAATVSIPCEIIGMERKVIETTADKIRWRLRILERNIDDLMNQTATAVAEKTDVSHLQAKVEKYQERISRTRVFGSGVSREERETMFELIKEIQLNLDQIQKMLAEYMRTGTSSISLLARAHDMRYQAVFNKGRRQRIMDKRATKNMQHAANAQKKLADLEVNQEEVKRLSQDALGFYFCVMSQNSVQDVLLGDDVEDAIGFGLAVRRSELVLDEPTLLRIHNISGTLVSRNAMLDALEYKINVSSQLKAHGGFEFDKNSLGITTVGSSREPINAWLPLYITASHWERIKVILKPALGSFCTLDPLGYHFKQLDVLFMVLGSMIGQLSDKNIGEHQLKLLFAVLRTCSACLVDFDKTAEVSEIVKSFVASPAGRTRDILPNLNTLIGYIVSLQPEIQKEIFPDEATMQKFWFAFISEWLRRAGGTVYKDTPLVDIHGTVNGLISATNADSTKAGKEKLGYNHAKELERMCLHSDSVNVEIPAFDPAAELKDIDSDIELTHSEHVDKAMEIWAEHKTGYQKNLDKTKKYKTALRQVKDWMNDEHVVSVIAGHLDNTEAGTDGNVKEATDSDAIKDNDAAEKEIENDVQSKSCNGKATDTMYDVDNITDYTLQVITQVQNKLLKSAYPNINSLPGLISFVNTWLRNEHSMKTIDENSGIAPGNWIQEIKIAILDSYKQLKTESVDGHTQTVVEQDTLGRDTLTDERMDAPVEIVVDRTERLTCAEQLDTGCQSDPDQAEDDSFIDFENRIGFSSDDDDFDNDEDDDDDDNDKQRSKEANDSCIGLPQIIEFVSNEADIVHTMRAMLCQAIRFHSNSSARAAYTSEQLLDISNGKEMVISILQLNHKFLDEFRANARQSAVERALWKRANHCMLWATTPWAFVGYLINTYTSRSEGFSDLIDLFMLTVLNGAEPPYLKEKVHILLTGKFETYPVLDNGNQWLPETKMAKKFKTLLGAEIWQDFEMELRSNIQIHVYRESDIPNRHGHCNSNPYIPNILRRKLGMELLPENNTHRSSRRRRR